MKKWLDRFKKHPWLWLFLVSFETGFLVAAVQGEFAGENYYTFDYATFIVCTIVYALFFLLPIFLTLIHGAALFCYPEDARWKRYFIKCQRVTIVLGVVYSYLGWIFSDITGADWDQVLYNTEVHTPIWSGGRTTILVLTLLAVAGYIILSSLPLPRIPPLVIVFSMAAMYIGSLLCLTWCVQIIGKEETFALGLDDMMWVFCLFPVSCIMIALRTIRVKIREWNTHERKEGYSGNNIYLTGLDKFLRKAENWPIAAFIVMLPLLGVVIGILVLFGQQPDALIKAWTETSDWMLSQKTAPPNLQRDMHYLCTVAAGGHERIVKPLRMGERHGHRVVVNRQLCVANAFEQILEKKIPEVHRKIRYIYDTYGFPVAKMIRNPLAADVVYLLMKPMEWCFLAVIYACDTKPENRIALQYLPQTRRGKS